MLTIVSDFHVSTDLLDIFQSKKLTERVAFQKSLLVKLKWSVRICVPVDRWKVLYIEGEGDTTQIVALVKELRASEGGCEGSGIFVAQRVYVARGAGCLEKEVQTVCCIRLAHHDVD